MAANSTWPRDKIRELIALADAEGASVATLVSRRDAELFRKTIYNFRSKHEMGQDLTVTLEDCSVILTKKTIPVVSIEQMGE